MRQKLFVDALPLALDKPSGVGHALAGLLVALAQNPEATQKYEIVLIAPKNRLHLLDRWPALKNCTRKGIGIKYRIINALMYWHLLPPVDLFLGKGIYLWGNFKNWPLTKKSTSLTYIYDISFVLYPQFADPINLARLSKYVPEFIARSDAVLTISDTTRQEIIDHYKLDPAKVLRLYCGVDRAVYRKHPQSDIDAVKQKYGITKPYVLSVGNIEPRKNLERLVQAFTDLPRDYALVLVGGMGWKNEPTLAAIKAAQEAGVTIIHPSNYVSDQEVGTLMSGAEVSVTPSLYEGFGMPPLEAMAAETPVIISDLPVLREVAGDAGMYCDPLDVASIKAALQKALALSPAQKQDLTKRGIIRADQFSWDASAQQLIDFIGHKL